MKVFEYLSYLRTVCPNLKFEEVIFAKPDLEDDEQYYYDGPYTLDCPEEDFIWYLNQEVGELGTAYFIPDEKLVDAVATEAFAYDKYIGIYLKDLY